MTGNMYGADIEALRLLADSIARGGEVLDGVVRAVESAMPVPEQWSGMDADGFRDEWYGSHGPSIAASAQALVAVADTVRGNADSQEATSDELSGGGVDTGNGIGVDDGRGIGVGPGAGVDAGNGIGVDNGRGIGVDAERPAEFYGEEPWFRDLVDYLGNVLTYPGLAAYALEKLGSGDWEAAGKGAGAMFGVAGVFTGIYQATDSIVDFVFSGESSDLYSAGDGWVGAVLSAGSLVPPVAPAFAIAGAVWGGLSIANTAASDRPLTQNLIDYGSVAGLIYNQHSDTQLSEDLADAAHDFYEPIFWDGMAITSDAMDGAESIADSVGDAANDVVDSGRDLLEDAGDWLGF